MAREVERLTSVSQSSAGKQWKQNSYRVVCMWVSVCSHAHGHTKTSSLSKICTTNDTFFQNRRSYCVSPLLHCPTFQPIEYGGIFFRVWNVCVCVCEIHMYLLTNPLAISGRQRETPERWICLAKVISLCSKLYATCRNHVWFTLSPHNTQQIIFSECTAHGRDLINIEYMDGWMSGWVDGRVDGRVDGWMMH